MKKLILLFLISTTACLAAARAAAVSDNQPADGVLKGFQPVKVFTSKHARKVTRAGEDGMGVVATLKYDALPDMKTPRMGHQAFPSGNDLVVVGGHTTGFALTKTAEIYRNGSWQSLYIVSDHDGAFSVMLSDGRMMVGGGFSSGGGIGQSRVTDIYDPKTNLFTSGPYLSTNRAQAKAINLDGKVYVSGNWYGTDDAIDCYDGSKFSSVGAMNGHSNPYMLSDMNGDLIVMSSYDTKGNSMGLYTDFDGSQYFVAVKYHPDTDEANLYAFPSYFSPMALPDDARTTDYQLSYDGVRSYLILSNNGKPILYLYEDKTLYYYDVDIPTKYSATGAAISWRGGVIVNEAKHEVYLIGVSGSVTNQTVHIISLNYYTDVWTIASASGFKHDLLSASWTLLSDGRLACTGGGIKDNTDAQRKAYIFAPPTAGKTDSDTPGPVGSGPRLIVWKKTGEKVSFDLHEAPITTFSGNNLVIRTNKTVVTYPRKDVLRYTYEQVPTSGIELQPGEREVQVNIDGDEVTFRGLKAGAVAKVYAVNGVLVAQQTAVAGQPLTVSIKNRPSGVYIVKADTETIKIMKK